MLLLVTWSCCCWVGGCLRAAPAATLAVVRAAVDYMVQLEPVVAGWMVAGSASYNNGSGVL